MRERRQSKSVIRYLYVSTARQSESNAGAIHSSRPSRTFASKLEHRSVQSVRRYSSGRQGLTDGQIDLWTVHALNHWCFDEIVDAYALSKPECIRLLARLDKLHIIDLLPNNKIRVRVARNFAWLPDGPIQQFFQEQVQNNFLRSRFDESGELMVFTTGMLSRTSNAAIQSRMKRMSAEFSELHHQDLELPLAERSGNSFLLALRPWVPESFKKLQRKL